MSYLLGKALHIVGFISWFAGLFYVVRLFVYHAEAGERPEAERVILQPQLELMAARLREMSVDTPSYRVWKCFCASAGCRCRASCASTFRA